MRRLSRTAALKSAAILSVLLGAVGLLAVLPFLSWGEAQINRATDVLPYPLVVAVFVFSILRIVGAYGVWFVQRWGIVLTILTNALDSVLAAPGLVFAPTIVLWLASIATILLGAVIILLCLWRDPNPSIT